MSGGSWGEAGLRWDVEGQSRIVVAARRDRADDVWGEMCAKVASVWDGADVAC